MILDTLFPTRFSQHARLIQLHTPLGPDVLLAERADIHERIGPQPDGAPVFEAEILALSTDDALHLPTLIGQPVRLDLHTAAGATPRPFHGHVVQAERQGSDGSLTRYRLRVQPWLAALAHRVDSWVFQGASVMQIIDEVLADAQGQGRLVPAWRWELADPAAYLARSLCIQYQESDLAFVERLMREEGLFCWLEHEAAEGDALGRHTLVIADHNGALADNPWQATVRYTGSDAVLKDDGLQRWSAARRMHTHAVHWASLDYRTLDARPVSASTAALGAPDTPPLRHADTPGLYAYEDPAQGERLARRRVEGLAAPGHQLHAEGTWRAASPGRCFTLIDHPSHDGSDPARDRFAVLAVQHRVRSNLSSALSARLDAVIEGRIAPTAELGAHPQGNGSDTPVYGCTLTAQPAALPVRMPEAASLLARPTVHGSQTAVVVGTDGDDAAPVHTDRDHRVRIQFHWQRGDRASHRLAHPGGSNAPGTAAAGTWVRVMERSIAGANWGAHFVPRVGQEVLVRFVGGDIDRPVIVGVVYNGRGLANAQGNAVGTGPSGATGNANAWFAGNGHTAVLAGLKTQALSTSATGHGGHNQFVLDDTPGAHRVELSTTQAHTWLQLGHLLQQQDNRMLAARGHGLDLATQAWGALRAGQGLLISAHGRPASTAQARQMDPREPLEQLQRARDRLRSLADSAHGHQARTASEAAQQPLPAEQGLLATATSLKGTQELSAPSADDDTAQGGLGRVNAWERPDLVVAAPAGIAQATPADAVWSAGTGTTLVAGGDVNQLAQGHHATSAKDGIVLFTYGQTQGSARANSETGVALHAASGSVHSQSQTGATRLTAEQAVSIASTHDAVRATAPKHVLLTAGGAAIRLEGGNITLMGSGAVTFKAGQKVFTSGASASAGVVLKKPAALPPCSQQQAAAAGAGAALI